MAAGYTAGQLLVPVKPDARGAQRRVRQEFANMPDPVVRIEADLRELSKAKAKAIAELDQVKAAAADPKLGLDIRELEGKADKARARLEDLRKRPYDAKVGADIRIAEVNLERIEGRLGKLQGRQRDIEQGLDVRAAEAKIVGLDARMDQLRAERNELKVDVDVDTRTAGERLAAFQTRAQLIRDVRTTLDLDIGAAMFKLSIFTAALLAIPVLVGGGALSLGSLAAALAPAVGLVGLLPAGVATAIVAVGALKVATSGFGDAVKAAFDPSNPEKYAEELAKLSPNARAAVQEIAGLRGQLTGLRWAAQDALFAGVAPLIGTLAGPYLPMAEGWFVRIAGAVNYAGQQFGSWLQGAYALQVVALAGGGAATVFENIMLAASPLAGTFITVAAIAMPILAQLTAGAGGVAGRLASWVGSAEGIQTITGWIWGGIEAVRQLWAVVSSVGSIFGALMSAANAAGSSFLTTLARITGEIGAFLNSAQGQTALISLFTNLRLAAETAMPGVRGILGMLGDLITTVAPMLPAAGAAFSALVGAARPLFDVLLGLVSLVLPPLLWMIQTAPGLFLGLAIAVGVARLAFSGLQAVLKVTAAIQAAMAVPAIASMVAATWGWVTALWAQAVALVAAYWPILLIIAGVGLLVAAVVYAWNNFDWFRNAVLTVWSAIQTAVSVVWNYYYKPILTALWTALQFVGSVFVWLWQNAIVPAWNAICAAFMWAWSTVIKPTLDFIWLALRFLGAVIFTVLVTPFVIAWNLISAAVMWAWNSVIRPAWDALVAFARDVIAPLMMWLWTNIILPVWNGIGAAISFVWNNVILPLWNALVFYVNGILIPLMQFLWNNVIVPVWNGIGAAISFVWNSIILPVWNALVAFVNTVIIPGMRFLLDNVIRPVWDAIGAAINFVWLNVIRPAWDAVAMGLSWLGDRFREGTDRIGQIWNALRGYVAKPINFLIGTVWNNGIVPVWNKVAQLVGIGPIAPLGLIPEFATGGRVDATGGGELHGPGTGTSDSILARVSRGEFVVREAIAAQHLPFLNALNSGQSEARQAAGGRRASPRGMRYRHGGEIDGYATGGMIDRARQFAAAQHGKPYIWGGVGPRGYDCSGIVAAVTNVLRGQNPHRRLGTSATFPWPGFRPGLSSAWSAGAFTGNPGHVAGTLGGTNVEAGGSPSRTKFGPGAVGADWGRFTRRAHLPEVGGVFASGGGGGGGGASWFNPIPGMMDAAKGIAMRAIAGFTGAPPPEYRRVPPALTGKAFDTLRDWASAKLEATFGGGGGGVGGPAIADVAGLSPRQRQAAGTIIGVAKSRRMHRKAAEIGVATAMVESKLGTIGYGRAVDHDSLGLFQQRPSMGWGTPAQVQDDVYASNAFLSRLGRINYLGMSHVAAAHAVQRSAFPQRVGQYVPLGVSAVNAFPGGFDEGGRAKGVGWMYKGRDQDERVLDPLETRAYDTLGPLVREMEAHRLPAQRGGLSTAQVDAMAGGRSTFPDTFRLTSDTALRLDGDGILHIVDGRLEAVADALSDGRRVP